MRFEGHRQRPTIDVGASDCHNRRRRATAGPVVPADIEVVDYVGRPRDA